MVNAGLVGIVIVFTIIAAAFSSYYVTIAPINGQISSYQSEITSMSQHATTSIVTTTSYFVSVVTVTSNDGATTTVTTVSTTTVTEFPLNGDNLTVWFRNSGSNFTYDITSTTGYANSSTTSLTSVVVRIKPIYTNEFVSISATCVTPCTSGSFNATIYFDASQVPRGFGMGNSTRPLSLNYTVP
jgi:hypothetical protein